MTLDLARLQAFEEALDPDAPESPGHRIVAYGEISAVLVLSDRDDLVLKRMAGFRDAAGAQQYCAVVRDYVAALRKRGVTVLPTEPLAVHSERNGHVVHLVQPRVPVDQLGSARLHGTDAEVFAFLTAIYERLSATYAPNDALDALALDAQGSNWTWDGAQLTYLDVGTPFLRRGGAEALDWSLVVRPLPQPLRAFALRFVVPGIIRRYYALDQAIVDLLANMIKEGRGDLLDRAVAFTNEWGAPRGLAPVQSEAIRRYYANDARIWELLSRVRRANRAAHRLVGARYGYLLPGPVKR